MPSNLSKGRVQLKKGKEFLIQRGHPWIFSGAIEGAESSDGSLVQVESHEGLILGFALYNGQSDIALRLIDGEENFLEASLKKALAMRSFYGRAFRWVNAEGDNLPALVIDLYNNVAVVQISHLFYARHKEALIEAMVKAKPDLISIYERSNSPSRKREGLKQAEEGLLFGAKVDEVVISELDLLYNVSIAHGQKSGHFFDHREMRRLARDLAKDKRVADICCYSGGFSLNALAGGAKSVVSVDLSKEALALVEKNIKANNLPHERHRSCEEDLFVFLEKMQKGEHDLIILDPPAFAKKKHDLARAVPAYKKALSLALQKVADGGFVIFASCSHFLTAELFDALVLEASFQCGRRVAQIGSHRKALDHPVLITHPEGEYLTSVALYVSDRPSF